MESGQQDAKDGVKLIDRAREEIKDLAQDLKEPQKTQLWKSVFRVKHERTDTAHPLPGGPLECLPASPSGKSQPGCRPLQLHLGHGRNDVLSVPRADFHRRSPDVLLPPHEDSGVPRHPVSRTRCAFRQAAAEHAPLGGPPDDPHALAAYVSSGVDRILQEAAGIQLVRGCYPAGADVVAVIHGLPAA